MSASIETLLNKDHQSIDELYETYLEKKLKSPSDTLSAFKTYKSALLRHIKCEEDLIFPVLSRATDIPAATEVPILRDEHQIIVPLLMGVEKCLKDKVDSTNSERHLFEELHEHNAREELRVYGFLDALLSDEQKQAISQELKSQRFFGG